MFLHDLALLPIISVQSSTLWRIKFKNLRFSRSQFFICRSSTIITVQIFTNHTLHPCQYTNLYHLNAFQIHSIYISSVIPFQNPNFLRVLRFVMSWVNLFTKFNISSQVHIFFKSNNATSTSVLTYCLEFFLCTNIFT
nr:MAG TPA: hypothetical protein [Caudoviricetes sp.]